MKRKNKEQREAEAKAALRQRIADIAVGASGSEFDNGDEFATADFLSRFVPALRVQFGLDAEGKERGDRNYFWFPSNLGRYDNIDTTTDFFFEHGVRA
jgi:hypothetical protein